MDDVKTYFFYSDEGLIAEYDESGTELRSYGYRPDSTWTTDPLWMRYKDAYYFYHNDHLGTPQKLTAQNGMVAWSAQYSAFGEATVNTEYITNNLRLPGQYYDAETGLHYNFQRYYDPGIGRYVSVDPIGFKSGDINFYSYGKSNSLKKIDPLGLNEIIISGGINVYFHGWEQKWGIQLWRLPMLFHYDDSVTDVIEWPLNRLRPFLPFAIAHDRRWDNFIEASIEEIKKRKQNSSPCEDIEWHVETGAYVTRSMMDEYGDGMIYLDQIRQYAAELGVILREFDNKEEFIRNFNSNPHEGTRKEFERISYVAYFGHGYPNAFALKHNSYWGSPYSLTSQDILNGVLSKSAFAEGATVASYACNSATEDGAGQSMKRAWEEYLGVEFYGAVGRTSYRFPENVGLEDGAYWVPEQPPNNPNPIPPRFYFESMGIQQCPMLPLY